MSGERNNFYFSRKSFETFKEGILNEQEYICECFINGEWLIYTEQIHEGHEPLSKAWGDLVFLGTTDKTRYTRTTDWVKSSQ